jgi:hypothetical protein
MAGMTNEQKVRLGKLLDTFKESNGGCLLCGKKIEEFFHVPSEFNGRLELHMYGACHGHTVLVESEAKMDAEVVRLREEFKNNMDKPKLLTVIYGAGEEEVKYA